MLYMNGRNYFYQQAMTSQEQANLPATLKYKVYAESLEYFVNQNALQWYLISNHNQFQGCDIAFQLW